MLINVNLPTCIGLFSIKNGIIPTAIGISVAKSPPSVIFLSLSGKLSTDSGAISVYPASSPTITKSKTILFLSLLHLKNHTVMEIKANPHATAEQMGLSLGLSSRMVRKYIATLRDHALIERVGGNKAGYWKVLKK